MPEPAVLTRRYTISGRVQGVYFRANTLTQATTLGLTGWVQNLPGGTVLCVAQGEEIALNRLREWFSTSPGQSHVDKVEQEEIKMTERFDHFALRATSSSLEN